MKRFLSCLLVLSILMLPACKKVSAAWTEQYELGHKYLTDGNYQEAILSFSAAIDIDPKLPDAYVGRGDAYIGAAARLADGGITPGTEQSQQILICLQNAETDYRTATELAADGNRMETDPEVLAAKLSQTAERLTQVEEAEAAAEAAPPAEQLPPEQTPQEEPEESPEEMPVYDPDNLVVDTLNQTLDFSYGLTCTYTIPRIAIEAPEIDAINEEIYNTLYPYYQESSSVGDFPMYGDISYLWCLNGDILSLVIDVVIAPDASPYDKFFVYNIDLSTMTLLDNAALLSHYGWSQEQYLDRTRSVVGAVWDSYWSTLPDSGTRSETLSDANLAEALPFLNEDGHLCLVCPLHFPIAGGYDEGLFDLETGASYTPAALGYE